MEQIHEQVKSDLLAFVKRNGAYKGVYGRLYAAETIEEVIEVVKDNFWWCAKFKDFADVIIAHRELFGEHLIFANQDVKIREGVAYLYVSEGTYAATSYDTSTINATSHGTSTINAMSCGTSTINAMSCDTSTINAESCDTSTINAESHGASMINAEGWGTSTMIIRTSTIECEVHGHSIARYVHENRIVVADDWLTVEKR